MLACCILTSLAIVILGIFSNRIDSSGEEVAIYERAGRLTLQKDPGIYFGLYDAHYFSKNPIIICGNLADSVEIFKTKECTSYTSYTLDFDNFVQTNNTLTPNHPKIKDERIFWKGNIGGERNTKSLIKMLLQLEEGGSKLPSYVIRKVSQ